MKRLFILVLTMLCGFAFTGCNEVLPEKIQVIVDSKKDEMKEQAISGLQKALTEQIQDFIDSKDLKKTLGLTDEEEEKVSNSFKEYLENYDTDSEEWKKAFDAFSDSITELKEDGKLMGISQEELSQKIKEFMDKEKE